MNKVQSPELQPQVIELSETAEVDPNEVLREQIDILISDGNNLANQLKAHGEHQRNVIHGHFPDQCRTCVVLSNHSSTLKKVSQTLIELFSSDLDTIPGQ